LKNRPGNEPSDPARYGVLIFSLCMLLLGGAANLLLILDAPHKPALPIYGQLFVAVGILGALLSIALRTLTSRIRKLEERLAAVTSPALR